MKQKSLRIRARIALQKKSLPRFIFDGVKLFGELGYYKLFKQRKFHFSGKDYAYFYYPYNSTWRNERAVEIPIAWAEVKKNKPSDVLEIGNVLSHYYQIKHDVVDKYEKAPGVMNEDIVKLKSKKRYKLIVAISTFEHVGWDEKPREPKKLLQGIENLKKILTPDGKILFTIPKDYNPELDKLILNKKLKLNKVEYLKRISKDNRWIEVDAEALEGVKFESPFPRANGLIVGTVYKR